MGIEGQEATKNKNAIHLIMVEMLLWLAYLVLGRGYLCIHLLAPKP